MHLFRGKSRPFPVLSRAQLLNTPMMCLLIGREQTLLCICGKKGNDWVDIVSSGGAEKTKGDWHH